jgi:hypothetical protein
VALSGGGWRAQAAAVGFLKALHASGEIGSIAAISSNSGGSWANTQYAFSEEYYNAVNTEEPATMYTNWLENYFKMFDAENYSAASEDAEVVAKFVRPLSHEIADYVMGAVGQSLKWESFISSMLDLNTPDNFSSKSATPANRRGLSTAEIIVATTLTRDGELDKDQGTDQLLINGKTPERQTIPLALVVPPTGESEWFSPQFPISDMEVQQKSAHFWQSNKGPSRLPMNIPSVGKAASMSSAAAGVLGTPSLLEAAANGLVGSVLGTVAKDAIADSHLEGMAVCSGPDDNCQYPSMRLLDGGYADDSGIALLVGRLQATHPGKNLRIAAMDSDWCTEAKKEGLSCDASLNYNWGDLFGNQSWSNGNVNVNGIDVPSVSAQIFDPTLTHVTKHGILVCPFDPAGQTCGQHSYSLKETTTIDNPVWGVKAGTKVQFFILDINSQLSTTVVPADVESKGKTSDEYSQLAQTVYKSLTANDVGKNAFTAFFADKQAGEDAVRTASALFEDPNAPTLE